MQGSLDLQQVLTYVIDASSFAQEMNGNYKVSFILKIILWLITIKHLKMI